MSFKVMCIRPINKPAPDAIGRPVPEVGDIDIVTDTIALRWGAYYILGGVGGRDAFDAERFSTLPTSTADEMEEEVKEGILM